MINPYGPSFQFELREICSITDIDSLRARPVSTLPPVEPPLGLASLPEGVPAGSEGVEPSCWKNSLASSRVVLVCYSKTGAEPPNTEGRFVLAPGPAASTWGRSGARFPMNFSISLSNDFVWSPSASISSFFYFVSSLLSRAFKICHSSSSLSLRALLCISTMASTPGSTDLPLKNF